MNAKKIQIYQQHFEKHIDAPEHVRNQIIAKFQEDMKQHVEFRNDQQILQKLPPPHKLAQFYLYTHGQDFRLGEKPTHPATLFFRGCLTVIILSSLFIYFFFSQKVVPFFENWGDSVVKKSFDIQIDSSIDDDLDTPQIKTPKQLIQGEISLSPGVKTLLFNGGEANLALKQTNSDSIKWDCKHVKEADFLKNEDDKINFNIRGRSNGLSSESSCQVQFPKDLNLKIDYSNSNIELEKLKNNIDLSVKNSNIIFTPHHLGKYQLNLDSINSNSTLSGAQFNQTNYEYLLNFDLVNSNLK
ncbi:hypothetical protein N9N67_03095 [Bacteriovoracaceae bacterium]|nr:hypothetical protein [Bacteriovoracaceae bacterium]